MFNPGSTGTTVGLPWFKRRSTVFTVFSSSGRLSGGSPHNNEQYNDYTECTNNQIQYDHGYANLFRFFLEWWFFGRIFFWFRGMIFSFWLLGWRFFGWRFFGWRFFGWRFFGWWFFGWWFFGWRFFFSNNQC